MGVTWSSAVGIWAGCTRGERHKCSVAEVIIPPLGLENNLQKIIRLC